MNHYLRANVSPCISFRICSSPFPSHLSTRLIYHSRIYRCNHFPGFTFRSTRRAPLSAPAKPSARVTEKREGPTGPWPNPTAQVQTRLTKHSRVFRHQSTSSQPASTFLHHQAPLSISSSTLIPFSISLPSRIPSSPAPSVSKRTHSFRYLSGEAQLRVRDSP